MKTDSRKRTTMELVFVLQWNAHVWKRNDDDDEKAIYRFLWGDP